MNNIHTERLAKLAEAGFTFKTIELVDSAVGGTYTAVQALVLNGQLYKHDAPEVVAVVGNVTPLDLLHAYEAALASIGELLSDESAPATAQLGRVIAPSPLPPKELLPVEEVTTPVTPTLDEMLASVPEGYVTNSDELTEDKPLESNDKVTDK